MDLRIVILLVCAVYTKAAPKPEQGNVLTSPLKQVDSSDHQGDVQPLVAGQGKPEGMEPSPMMGYPSYPGYWSSEEFGGSCMPEYGVAFRGGESYGYRWIHHVYSWEACGRFCSRDHRCTHWTWVVPLSDMSGHAEPKLCRLNDRSYGNQRVVGEWRTISGSKWCYDSIGSD